MPRGVSIARGTAAICSRVEHTFDLLARRPPPGQDFARLPHPTHNPNCKAAAGTRRPGARRTGVSPGIPCCSGGDGASDPIDAFNWSVASTENDKLSR